MAKLLYANGVTSVILRVKIMDSTSTSGGAKTGLTFSSSGLIISTIADNEATATAYTEAGSTIETITTLGTFAAPTATKCRFKEVDSTNHPGLYELQIADARWTVIGAKSVIVTVSGVTGAAQVDAEIQLSTVNLNASGGKVPATLSSSDVTGNVPSDAKAINAVSTSSVTAVNANLGTTQPVNFTGTGSTAYVKAGLWEILGTVLTETAGQLAAGFKKFFNVASPTFTIGSTNQTGDSFALIGATGSGLTSLATASSQTSILNAVNAITTNTSRTGITLPGFMPLPASGTSPMLIEIKLFDIEGHLEDADTNTVTVHAKDASGNSLDANLASTTATRDSTGQYHANYTLNSTDSEGGVYITATYSVGAVSMAASAAFTVAQADTVTSIAAIKAKTDNLPASPAAVGSAMTLTSAYDAAKNAQQADSAVTLPANPPAGFINAAAIAAGAMNGKGDWTVIGDAVILASDGLDGVTVETGLNARQALAINSAAMAGVLAGAATTTVTIAAAGVPATNRITATVDADGNRSAVALSPPA